MSLITDELVRAVRTATPCRLNTSANRAENVLSLYRFCCTAVRVVPRVFVCVPCPGRSGRPARIPGIVTLVTYLYNDIIANDVITWYDSIPVRYVYKGHWEDALFPSSYFL
jgi:hypothetical protein